MEQVETLSLIDELQLKNEFEIVAQQRGKVVYKQTIYYEFEDIDYEKYITETDEPVDNIFSEKQQRLSIDALRNARIHWTKRNFMTASNVGIYYDPNVMTPVVPDMFLSFDVKQPNNWFEKKHKAYFTWVIGKVPDLILEIVSNKVGDEDTKKLEMYEKIGVKYYIIQDPYQYLSEDKLRLYVLDENGKYQQHISQSEEDFFYMPEVNLGMTLWRGLYEETEAEWMRWVSKEGNILTTGKEAVAEEKVEKAKLEEEKAKAEEAKKQAEEAKKEAEQKAEVEKTERQKAEEAKKQAEEAKKEAEEAKKEAEQKAEEEKAEKEALVQKMKELEAKLASLGLRPLD